MTPDPTPDPEHPRTRAAAVPADEARSVPRNFVTDVIDEDLARGRVERVVTRFPPEPNGYAHVGHAYASFLDFGLAADYGGVCNLRFDDTNPETEEMEYVEAIEADLRWLGWDWGERRFFASDYFDELYELALRLISMGDAYVDSLPGDRIAAWRGSVDEPGRPSPDRDRSVEENLDLFRRMRAGEFPTGSFVLRAKIDMASPNMKMRDPILYRVLHHPHYRTGDRWPIYPMYDFAHPLSDAIEGVTHSLCSLEFVDNREVYDWLVERLFPGRGRPRQYEFGRRSLESTVVSKRKLIRLVREGVVDGWDDPRLPTLAALRRRGVRPEAVRAFAAAVGVSRTTRTVEMAKLEHAVRDDLNAVAPRVMAVTDPLKLVIVNRGEVDGEAPGGAVEAPYWPPDVPGEGSRRVPVGRELWIERDDFALDPPKGFKRLAPGRVVRLRHAWAVEVLDAAAGDDGAPTEVRVRAIPGTLGGDVPEGVKVRGAVHWVDAATALPAAFRLYDRLFTVPDPGSDGRDLLDDLNPGSLVVRRGWIEPSVADDPADTRYQFERLGYFWRDPEAEPGDDGLVFGRIVTLKDSWARRGAKGREPDAQRPTAKRPAAAERPAPAAAGQEPDPVEALDPDGLERFASLEERFDLPRVDAALIAADADLAAFFEAAVEEHGAPASLANWVVNELQRELKQRAVVDLPFGPAHFARLVRLVDDGRINARTAKEVFARLVAEGGDPEEIVAREGLELLSDPAAVAALVDEAMAANPGQVEAYRGGKAGLKGFFVGQVMRASGGRADPGVVQEVVGEKLDG